MDELLGTDGVLFEEDVLASGLFMDDDDDDFFLLPVDPSLFECELERDDEDDEGDEEEDDEEDLDTAWLQSYMTNRSHTTLEPSCLMSSLPHFITISWVDISMLFASVKISKSHFGLMPTTRFASSSGTPCSTNTVVLELKSHVSMLTKATCLHIISSMSFSTTSTGLMISALVVEPLQFAARWKRSNSALHPDALSSVLPHKTMSVLLMGPLSLTV